MARKKAETGYWSLVEPVWTKINIYGSPDEFMRSFEAVDPSAAHLFAIHWCVSEVENGGFDQFFYNPTGVLAPEAAAGCLLVGLPATAQVISEAMRFFGQPYPRERRLRISLLTPEPGKKRKDWDPFHDLDEQFYDSIDERLYPAMNAYAAKARARKPKPSVRKAAAKTVKRKSVKSERSE